MNSRHSADALSERDADALLSGRVLASHEDLRAIVGLMRTASAVSPPRPTAALAAVLQNGMPPLPVGSAPQGSSRTRWSLRLAAVATAAVTATLGAATANALPAPVQTAVANVVDAVTSLQLPRPAEHAESSSGSDLQRVDARYPDDETEARSVQPTGGTPTTPGAAAPDLGAPSRGARTTPPAPQQVEELVAEADEPDADQRDADESDSDESDADVPDSDEPDADVPDSDEPDADVPDSDEPDADVPDSDEPDAGALDTNESDAGDDDVPDSEQAEPDSPERDEEHAATES